MHEGFDFRLAAETVAYLFYFGDIQLACQHHPRSAQPRPEIDGVAVCSIGLRGNMDGHSRSGFPRNGEHARVADQNGVGAGVGKPGYIVRQFFHVGVFGVNVHRYIHLFAEFMGIIDAAGYFIVREIVGIRPEAEIFAREIDGVGAVEYGLDADVGRPSRCQQLDFPGLNHLISSIL